MCTQSTKESSEKKTEHLPVAGSSQSLMKSFATNESVMKADILWSLKSAMAHFSFTSSADIEKPFQKMFPDSNIAKKFAHGKWKMNYLVCFRIDPYL